LDPGEAERFERYCEERGFKKSTLIARLVRENLDAQDFGTKGEGKVLTPQLQVEEHR